MAKLPQHSDIKLKFENIQYDDGTAIDLSLATDIIISITRSSPSDESLFVSNYTVTPDRFNIDNVNKTIEIMFVASEVGSIAGKYYTNLWIIMDGRYQTHLTKTFEIDPAVHYTLGS